MAENGVNLFLSLFQLKQVFLRSTMLASSLLWPPPRIVLPGPVASMAMATHPPLKSRLSSGERLYGSFLCSFSPTFAEILGWSGYDFVVVDMEHGSSDSFEALHCVRALHCTRTPCIIRVASNDPVLVKKALDLGPDGIMIPMVGNAEEASLAVSACRYPPRGIRGAAPSIVRASRYGILAESYLRDFCDDDQLLIILQIESPDAVALIPDIASVPGVDCLTLGPADLSGSVGFLHDPSNERSTCLLRQAEHAVLSVQGMFLAGFAMPHDPPHELFRRGCHMVSGSVDVGLLRNAALADVKANKHFDRLSNEIHEIGSPAA